LGFGLRTVTVPGIPSNLNYLHFIVPGIIGMGLLFSSVFSGLTVISDRQFGFLKEIMVAPVSRVSIVIGRILGGSTVSLIQGILLIIITTLLGFELPKITSLPLALLFMILITTTFISLGLIFASRMKDTQGFSLIVNFIVFPIFFLSGAIYPINNLPQIIKYLSYVDPLTYGVDGLRSALIGFSFIHPIIDLAILASFSLIMVIISAYSFEKSKIL
jgi:ABC-2 type transport system permease protein